MKNWQKNVTSAVISEAAAKLGVPVETIKHVGGFENKIYSFHHASKEYILRVSHSSHRSEEQTISEMHWVHHLAVSGVRVSKPEAFVSGRLTERLEAEEGYFVLTQYEKAAGRHVKGGQPEWGPELFEAWGKITGVMHKLAKAYTPPQGIESRPSVDRLAGNGHDRVSGEKAAALQRYEEMDAAIRLLAREPDTYGLCHRDLHHGNFHVHNGEITAFDFDDCGYDLFIQDIAMAVYYGSAFADWNHPETDRKQINETAASFLHWFMKGYERENTISSQVLKQLPLFMERRRCDLTLILFDVLKQPDANVAQRKWLEQNIREINENVPCIELW